MTDPIRNKKTVKASVRRRAAQRPSRRPPGGRAVARPAAPGPRHGRDGRRQGKTTSALGQALCAGTRLPRRHVPVHEGAQIRGTPGRREASPGLVIRLCGLDSFVMRDRPAPVDVEMAREGFALAREAVRSGAYDMVILDEINVAVDFRLIPLKDVLDLVAEKPPALDLILTGRYAAPELIAIADTVSEIREVKHHYAAGVKDRAGIEY